VVWIVDDSPLDAQRARQVLDGHYQVTVFGDGSAMLEHLASHPAPDVLVLDWVMPGVSGIEVCRFLREGSAPRPQLAILLLTMQTRTDDIVEGLAAGANDYLVKPYADPELRARVDALVRWNGLLDRAQKAEASVLQLLEHAPDPFISVDRHRLISYVNAEAQRALGQGTPGLLGRPLAEVLPALPMDQLGDAARTSRPLGDIEIGDRLFSPTIRSLPSAGDVGLTIALRDVTSRRRKESRRLDFYSIIAHDLRSPLAAMLMRTDLMLRGRRGVLSADVIADLRKMDSNMRRLVALINDFLDFARMEEAAHKMDRARVDLGELIGEVVDDFKPLAENTGQQIRVQVKEGGGKDGHGKDGHGKDGHGKDGHGKDGHGKDGGGKDGGGKESGVVVLGDRRRLQQVLANLVANAIKFTPPLGCIGVYVRAAGPWCEVDVEDDGPGIPEEIMPTLFQRYSRGPNTHVDAGGTGLGLLIVREIVEAHGGTVGVDRRPERGSRFWFRIPAVEPSDRTAGMPVVESPQA
jgi:signal transduction histidine kinase